MILLHKLVTLPCDFRFDLLTDFDCDRTLRHTIHVILCLDVLQPFSSVSSEKLPVSGIRRFTGFGMLNIPRQLQG